METKQSIKAAEDNNTVSPSLPGNALSPKAFKILMANAENTPAISLKEAQSKWADQRKQLQKTIR